METSETLVDPCIPGRHPEPRATTCCVHTEVSAYFRSQMFSATTIIIFD
jgi:hypothetical protein